MKIVHTNIIHYPVFPRILYREVIMINMRQSKRRHYFYMLLLVTCNTCIISFHNTSNSIIKKALVNIFSITGAVTRIHLRQSSFLLSDELRYSDVFHLFWDLSSSFWQTLENICVNKYSKWLNYKKWHLLFLGHRWKKITHQFQPV